MAGLPHQPTGAERMEHRDDRGDDPDPGYRLLFDCNPHPMWVYDLETLRFLAVNDVAVFRYGYARDEFAGMTLRDIRPAEDVPALLDNVSRVTEGLDEAGVWRHRKKDGQLIEVEITSHTITWKGRPAELVLAVDVTDRRRAEREQRALERRMRETQRMESLAVLAGGAAHDFNNILMAVLGRAELAKEQVGPDSPAWQDLEEIERAARRAAELSQQLLAYAGKGRFTLQPLELDELVEDVRHIVEVSLPKGVTIAKGPEARAPTVIGDATQLRQVVLNLMINAVDAVEDGGSVQVATGATDCNREYLARAILGSETREGRCAYVEVSDDGSGIPPEVLPKIFDPFFTTKSSGRGLGLAAVLGIVRGHGGAIGIESSPGTGTTVRVVLPVAEED